MKLLQTLICTLIVFFSFAQQAYDYSFSLLEIENLSTKNNINFQNNSIIKSNNFNNSTVVTKAINIEPVEGINPFIALSINNDISNFDINNTSLFYKVKAANNFTEWIQLKIDKHTQRFEQVYIANNSSSLQFKIEANKNSSFELNSINYSLYYPGVSTTSTIQNSDLHKSLNCNCPLPDIKYRNDWCPSGNCPKDTNPTPTTFSHLVVHHSAGSNTSPDWGATVRSIWNYHTSGNGWDDVGYNYLIDPNGVIYEGRGNNVRGAHFSCMNSGAMGVCLLGDFNNVIPSTAMINSLIKLMGWKACELNKSPLDTSYFANANQDLINLCGHRDGNSIPASCTVSECPGNNVYDILGTIRSNIVNYAQNCTVSNTYSNIVILEMNATSTTVYVNEGTELEVKFKNAGNASINEQLNISYRVDGNEVNTSSFNSLNIGETKTANVPYTFNATGTYRYCSYIDAASNELISNNNSYCVDVEVLARPTRLSSLDNSSLYIYPNPAKNKLFIEGDKYNEIQIFNTIGQLLIRQKKSPIDINELPNGMYYIKIKQDNLELNSSFIKAN